MEGELYREVEIDLAVDAAMQLRQILDEGLLPELSGYYEVLYEEDREDRDRTKLVLYFPALARKPSIAVELLLAAQNIEDYKISETSVLQKDYLESYKKFYRAFAAGDRLIVVPSWDRDAEKEAQLKTEEKIALYLDPGLAFGTGQHATTRMCLKYLEKKVRPGMRIIDAGCGSGILSIAAFLLGAERILAFDIDANAVHAAHYSAGINPPAADHITVLEGGFDTAELRNFKPDLLIGNLTKNIILQNAGPIQKLDLSLIAFSGILETQEDEVIEIFSPKWKTSVIDRDDGWILIELTREV